MHIDGTNTLFVIVNNTAKLTYSVTQPK